MKIAQLTATGKREHNEDSYLVLESNNIFMVCDGVGGSAKGEIASRLCCDSFRDFFSRPGVVADESTVQQAVALTEARYDAYFEQHEEARGMATTLTFVSLQHSRAIIAHAGDSRVYHISNGVIRFVTTDHSLVNEMLASGFITPEEAIDHPKKNHITRAIQGSNDPVTPDLHIVNDLKPGDFFLLCSDGVLESISEQFIQAQFIAGNNPVEIAENINALCAVNSRDNYTCIVVQTEAEKQRRPDPAPALPKAASRNKKKPGTRKYILPLVVLLAGIGIGYFLFAKSGNGKNEKDEPVRADTAGKKEVRIKPSPIVVDPKKSTVKTVVVSPQKVPAKKDSLPVKKGPVAVKTPVKKNDTLNERRTNNLPVPVGNGNTTKPVVEQEKPAVTIPVKTVEPGNRKNLKDSL